MKNLVEIKNSKPKTLRIQYEVSNLCNYKCWYCFPEANSGTYGWPDLEVIKRNLSKVIEFYFANGIDEIQMNFLGGEPTLWRHLGELVEHLSNNTQYNRKKQRLRLTMQTNASRTLRWWKEYGHYFDHVGISVHHERADVSHISNVAEILLDKKVSVLTTVLMDHTAWDKCKSLVDQLISTKRKFMVLARPIHIDGVTTYNEDQRKYLKTHRKRNPAVWDLIRHFDKYAGLPKYTAIFDDGSKKTITNEHYFILNRLNNFFGWQCTIGTNFLSITREGYLSGTCRVKLYGLDDYYNINDPLLAEKFNPILQTVTCDKTACLCGGETVISKWKTNNKKVIPIYGN